MKCFHHNKEAIGICKHCQRALCSECCTDLGHGLACKDRHESEVETLNSLIQDTKKVYESQPKATLFAPVFYLFIGLVFVYFGYQEGLDSLAFILGSGFVVFGIAIFIYDTILLKKLKKEHET